ncbi:MAG TPA: adenylosuccinate lyase [Abditibacteriaceae bacterium]|jgi:adenylosuccinate lyase
MNFELEALSPLDGRYAAATRGVANHFSEAALIKARVRVEIEWLLMLSRREEIAEVRTFSTGEEATLRRIGTEIQAERVKEIEATTRHDVKAVEYAIKEQLEKTSLADVKEWVHFACTSEDINNLAHGLMLRGGIEEVWLPLAREVVAETYALAQQHAELPLLARTHGQTASPTTVGKELAVFVRRWKRAIQSVESIEYLGKINGAVGNWNAHTAAYPDAPWQEISRDFVQSLGLTYNPLTTQIEAHDYMAELFDGVARFNTILLDFDRDIWTYISLGYFKQKLVAGEVGSSTMPHKVNPIDFENSEANIGLANAIFNHLSGKLPVSRLQRDLTDSSALRNMGVGVGYSVVALSSVKRGLKKLEANEAKLLGDLDEAWEVLGEAVQTVMRKAGHENPYEKLKELTRGARITAATMREFVEALDLPDADKTRLREMTPASYIGLAPELVEHAQ